MTGAGRLWRRLAAVAAGAALVFRPLHDHCLGVLVLRNGSLTGQFVLSPGASTSTGAITGGTGAYANARGVIVSKRVEGGSKDSITLAG